LALCGVCGKPVSEEAEHMVYEPPNLSETVLHWDCGTRFGRTLSPEETKYLRVRKKKRS
jgi:hypothetical protein